MSSSQRTPKSLKPSELLIGKLDGALAAGRHASTHEMKDVTRREAGSDEKR